MNHYKHLNSIFLPKVLIFYTIEVFFQIKNTKKLFDSFNIFIIEGIKFTI